MTDASNDLADDLHKWLRTRACLHPKILPVCVQKLEEEDIFSINDLRMLHEAGRLDDVCKTMTALKIGAALDADTDAPNPLPGPPSSTTPPQPGRLPHPATAAVCFQAAGDCAADTAAVETAVEAAAAMETEDKTEDTNGAGEAGEEQAEASKPGANPAERVTPEKEVVLPKTGIIKKTQSDGGPEEMPDAEARPKPVDGQLPARAATSSLPPRPWVYSGRHPDRHLPYLFKRTGPEWKALETYDRWLRGTPIGDEEDDVERPQGPWDLSKTQTVERLLEGVGLKCVIDVRRPAAGQEAVLRAECEDGEIWEGGPVGRLPWPGELMRELLTQAQMDYEAHQARHPGFRYGMTQLEQWRHNDEWERLQDATPDSIDVDNVGADDFDDLAFYDSHA